MKTIIITGMSGAGKTAAIHVLEDIGYYCVDNMPPALIKNFIELTVYSNKRIKKAWATTFWYKTKILYFYVD